VEEPKQNFIFCIAPSTLAAWGLHALSMLNKPVMFISVAYLISERFVCPLVEEAKEYAHEVVEFSTTSS
jgi:hypothetical protein